MNNYIDKDTLFMSMACLTGMASKDSSTKVGAVIVGPDDEVISLGYNGFPRKVNDLNEVRWQRPDKYDWVKHGEENAIINAARIGVSCKGARIYTPFHPCPSCAGSIVNAGIKEVIIHKQLSKLLIGTTTLDSKKLQISKTILAEGGVSIREIDKQVSNIIITVAAQKVKED